MITFSETVDPYYNPEKNALLLIREINQKLRELPNDIGEVLAILPNYEQQLTKLIPETPQHAKFLETISDDDRIKYVRLITCYVLAEAIATYSKFPQLAHDYIREGLHITLGSPILNKYTKALSDISDRLTSLGVSPIKTFGLDDESKAQFPTSQ